MRHALSLVAALALVLVSPACGLWTPQGEEDAGDSQARYEFPGCPNEDATCPRLKTLACAVERLRAEHDAPCSQASDCARVELANDCVSVSACGGLPLHASGAAAFRAEAQAEVDRYCGPTPACRGGPSCVNLALACEAGRCVTVVTP